MNVQWAINVVELRKLSTQRKKMKRRKTDFVFSFCGLFYSFASLRENKTLSKRH